LNSTATIVLYLWHIWIPYCRKRWEEATQDAAAEGATYTPLPDRYYPVEDKKEDVREEEEETELKPFEKCIFALGDANLVTAIAIIVSSMYQSILDPNYPLYHLFLARSLAAIALVGYNSTGVLYHLLRKKRKWSILMRWFLSIATIVLYIVWSSKTIDRFRQLERTWDRDDLAFAPACLSSHWSKLVPFSFSFWINTNYFLMPTAFFSILVSPIPYIWGRIAICIKFIDKSTFRLINGVLKDIWESELIPDEGQAWKKALISLWQIIWLACESIIVLILCFLNAFFVPAEGMQPIAALILGLLWNGWDIMNIKLSNWNTVVDALDAPLTVRSNPERDFGFGQVFPIVMFLQVILTVLDAVAGKHFILRFQSSKLKALSLSSSTLRKPL
jgi:hypothetical protein